MSTFYTRECGPDGQILVDEGLPDGESLSSILDHGPLTIKVALELVACVADVLSLADEDGEVHGDLKPGLIRLDSRGLVHVVGYGEGRRGGRTPEGRSGALSSDVYGLGLILIAILTTQAMGAIPREREAHDALIVSRLQQVNWQEIAHPEWQAQVVQWLLGMLSFEPMDRPHPLDVAHVMHDMAQKISGEDLLSWVNREVESFTESESTDESSSVQINEDLPAARQLAEPSPIPVAPPPASHGRPIVDSSAKLREKIQRVREEGFLPEAGPKYVPPIAPQRRPAVGDMPYLPDSTVREKPPTTLVPSLAEPTPAVPTSVPATVPKSRSSPGTDGPAPPVHHLDSASPSGSNSESASARISMGMVLGILLTILGGATAGIAYVLIWDDEEEETSESVSERESNQPEPPEQRETKGLLPIDTGTPLYDGMTNDALNAGSHAQNGWVEGVDRSQAESERRSDSAPLTNQAAPAVNSVSKPPVIHRPSTAVNASSSMEEVNEPSVRKATVSLRFYDERATYLCTPGDISGEFQSQTTFDLSLQDHSYPEAVSTCLVRTIDRYASQANSGLRGSFTVQGLGRKQYRCERGESALNCRLD